MGMSAMANLRQDIRRWGANKALYVRTMRRLEKYLRFRLFVIHTRTLDPNAPRDAIPSGCEARVLDSEELLHFSHDPALGLSSDFVAKAAARRDVCFGYLEQGMLVAYTWVGTQSTPAEEGLWVRFGERYSYGYKALTLASHRGRHLQECLVHLTDRWQTARGLLYNIDYIHTLNLPSIVANRRYGNRPLGYAGYLMWFGRKIPFRTPAVAARGFGFFVPKDG
jgi:hypothetical protein